MKMNDIITESKHKCPHCGGPMFSEMMMMEKKDACYYKVKASAKVWPSAYASGRLVQCRKKGAGNYGNKSEGVAEGSDFFAGSKFADEDGNTFSVEKIIAFAKKNPKYFLKDFPLSKIKHDLSWWQGNKERMMNADTSFPLLVIKNDDGHLGVADGLNRMKKAVDVEKKTTIDVYLVPKKDIMKFSEKQGVAENFADGRNPQDKGDAKRHGINTKASVSSLRKTAKRSSGRKQELAHWMANMKSGRAKNEDIAAGADGADPGILFYAKLPDGPKVYARPKDAEQLADLQQKYRGAEIKTFDYNRPDVIKWLQARGVKLRSFWLGTVLIMSGVMEAAHTTNFNDDDWYEINPGTKTIVSQRGPQAYHMPFGQRQIDLPNGNMVVRGMRAKGMGLDTGLDTPQQKEDGTWGAL